MPLNTSSKRRSSVRILSPWMAAPPSPTDTPGVVDQADQQHTAWSYSGILATARPPESLIRRRGIDYLLRKQRGR